MYKKLIIIGIALAFAFCHSKKKTTAVKPAEKTVVAARSPLAVAQKRWPGATDEELAQGKTIFETKCTKCHGAKKIVTRSEKSWLHEIDDMSPKAHLTPEEKEKLTRYILSYREANTSAD